MAGRKDKAGAYVCVLAVPNAESRAAIELDLTEANLRGWGALTKAL